MAFPPVTSSLLTEVIENTGFRKKSKLDSKKEAAVRNLVSDMVERYLDIEQSLDIQSEFIYPFSNRIISTGEGVEQAVNYPLKRWQLYYYALPIVINF